MAEIVALFPEQPAPTPGRTSYQVAYQYAVDMLEDAAEVLEEPGSTCGRADLLRVQCRLMVEHYGVERTLDLLETAQFYVASFRSRPPGGAA